MKVVDNAPFLAKLLEAPSPSGYEKLALDVFENEVKTYTPFESVKDKFGNTYFKAGHGDIKVLLSGHIDEVSAMVSYISDDGMISISQAGGIDRKDLIASNVILLLDNYTTVPGIVIKTPIHLEDDEDSYDKVTEFSGLRVDIGCDSKESVLNLGVHPGTPVLYERSNDLHFGANKMHGAGLDDKIGLFVAEEIFRYISSPLTLPKGWTNKYTVYCLAATQEEVGCRSVCVAAREINPDISIDFDVTFATDGDLGLSKSKYGDIQLGKGPVISYGGDKSPRLNMVLKQASSSIYQEAVGCVGGTNTNNIQKFAKNCETTLISIPNRSMHTRVETCDWRDVKAAVDMVSRAIILEML